MADAREVLTAAGKHVGYDRWHDPDEGTIFGRWYAGKTRSPYFGTTGVPYCAMFVSKVFDEAGMSIFGDGRVYAYCPWIVRDARALGRLRGFEQIQPGDILLFDWDDDGVADHVGFAARRVGDYVHTIEGNTSRGDAGSQSNGGGVYRRVRHRDTVCAVVRPAYTAAAGKPAARSAAPAGLAVDGVWGGATTRALQRCLGTPVDGVISSQDVSNFEFYPAAGAGWEWSTNPHGSQLIVAVQRRLGASPDGIAGRETAKRLQSYLGVNADGYVGEQTVKALQRRLNEGKF